MNGITPSSQAGRVAITMGGALGTLGDTPTEGSEQIRVGPQEYSTRRNGSAGQDRSGLSRADLTLPRASPRASALLGDQATRTARSTLKE